MGDIEMLIRNIFSLLILVSISNFAYADETNYTISMVSEEGYDIPSFEFDFNLSEKLTFAVVKGNAVFPNGENIIHIDVQDGKVIFPGMTVGKLYDESFMEIYGENEKILPTVRVSTIPQNGISNLLVVVNSDAILKQGATYAVVDESRISYNDNAQGRNLAGRVCFRAPWGPGKVVWNTSNPGRTGWGYSVKPESSFNLIWARGNRTQNIDAIYRKSWRCGKAFKVPNNCTVTFDSRGRASSCCNAATASLGKVPHFVYTFGVPAFPNCPLF